MIKKLRNLRLWKKLLIFVLLIIIIGTATFFIYVGDFYQAQEYSVADVIINEYDGFTVYGDKNSDIGFIFYPGGLVETKAYEPIICELSKQGICCVLVDMPFHLAVFGTNKADTVISELSTIDTWYIGGHSLGGAMASAYAAENSNRVSGLVLLGAYSTVKLPENLNVLSIYGSEDKVLNKNNYEKYRGNITIFQEFIIEGGNHSYFGNYGLQDGDGEASIKPEEQWKITSDTILEWMKQE